MKKIVLRVIILSFSFLISHSIHAYWWRFNNHTTTVLLLKVKLQASDHPYYAVALPNSSALFAWNPPSIMAGFCFDKLEWCTLPQEILDNRSFITDNYSIVSNKKIKSLFSGDKPFLTLNNAHINYLPSQLYNKTVKAAEGLFFKKAIQWGAQLHATSRCKSRNIIIQENEGGSIQFFTQEN